MKRVFPAVLFIALSAFIPTAVHANTITLALGVVSFDPFLPPPPSPSTNAFNLTNFTGSIPVATSVFFNNASISLMPATGAAMFVPLGNVGPGPLLDSMGNPLFNLQFPTTQAFSSATFSATLGQTTFLLSNGQTVKLLGPTSISVMILPSSGTTLNAGVDFAVITVNATSSVVIPEPSSLVLLATGLAAGWGCQRRKVKSVV